METPLPRSLLHSLEAMGAPAETIVDTPIEDVRSRTAREARDYSVRKSSRAVHGEAHRRARSARLDMDPTREAAW
ncbi:MAG: hypothetical protein KC766_13490 [Myxococcales bacterium]|nr:hypothetical protein [Myxococcales bacterium]